MWVSAEPSLVVDLSEQRLADGDYEVSLIGNDKVVQQSTLRLRSSRTPDFFSWEAAPRLVHDLLDPLTVVTAQVWRGAGELVAEGPWAPTIHKQDKTAGAGHVVWWTEPKPAAKVGPAPIVIAGPDPMSCIVTGAHRIELPTFYGRPTSSLVTGRLIRGTLCSALGKCETFYRAA
jgi:hypothetical protein